MTSTGQWLPGFTGHYPGFTGHYPGYAGHYPGQYLYHPRTALDVLQPSVGYTYSYPWARNSLPLGKNRREPQLLSYQNRALTEF